MDLLNDERLATARLALADGIFSGMVAIVSGGGSGIGKAAAWALARLGAKVVICGRSPDRLEAARVGMASRGLDVATFPVNIRDENVVADLFHFAAERFGQIDILVNNAGGQFPQSAIDFSPKGWRAVIDTNLSGTWLMMQRAAQEWRDLGRGGVIVNIAAAVERGVPGIAHTGAARAGVINLSRTVAVEWAPLGIRVNCIAPGTIDSGGLSVYGETVKETMRRANPQKDFGDPWDLAQIIAFMASDSTRFMTGSTVTVDGGGALWGDMFAHGRPAYFDEAGSPDIADLGAGEKIKGTD